MQFVGLFLATTALLALPCNGQQGLFPQFLPSNLLSKEDAPILSNAGSQNNATESEPDRTSDVPMSSQGQTQELPQQQFDGMQQPQQPYQLPGQQASLYPQFSSQQSSQYSGQQQPTQYPQQDTQYPQQSPPSLSSLLSKQGTQYPQQNPQGVVMNKSVSNINTGSSIGEEQRETATASSATSSQSEVRNVTTSATTPITTTTTHEPEKTGMDQKNGEAESLVDYALGLAGYNGKSSDQTETETSPTMPPTETPTPTPTSVDVSDCGFPASLQSCGMPEDVQRYFNFNVSVRGALSSIFKPRTVAFLNQECQPGSWCLPYDEHLDIMDGMDSFYLDGPMCSVAMWSCMERISNARQGCDDKDLSFLMASVQTLCNLSEFGLTDKRCYTRTVEALYATYVNIFPPADKIFGNQDDYCKSYKAKMSKTYLCADDSCSYDQKIVLERFQPWRDIIEDASAIVDSCNMTDMCQYEDNEDYLEEVAEEIEEEYDDYAYDYYDSDYDEYEDEVDEDEEEYNEQEEGAGFGEVSDGMEGGGMGETFKDMMGVSSSDSGTDQQFEDYNNEEQSDETLATQENIVLGLVVVIAMAGVVLMCLIVVIFKRYQTNQMVGHRGYSKLAEDESRILHAEYS